MHQKRTPKQDMREVHIKAREEQKISFVEYASKHQLCIKKNDGQVNIGPLKELLDINLVR